MKPEQRITHTRKFSTSTGFFCSSAAGSRGAAAAGFSSSAAKQRGTMVAVSAAHSISPSKNHAFRRTTLDSMFITARPLCSLPTRPFQV